MEEAPFIIYIPERVPSLNDLFEQRMGQAPARGSMRLRGQSSARFNRYSETKRKWIGLVKRHLPAWPPHFDSPQHFTYLFLERNKKRDPSNFCSAGVKLVEDGLVKAGVLSNDGWRNVAGFTFHWTTSDVDGVMVAIDDEPVAATDMLLRFA